MSLSKFVESVDTPLKKVLLGGLAIGAVAGVYYLTTKKAVSVKATTPFREDVWKKPYDLTVEQMRSIISHIQSDMDKGLENTPSTLKMLPSFVSKPKGSEEGTFLALDLGGTNFRVIKLSVKGGKILESGPNDIAKYTISESAMTGDYIELFDFIANSVKQFCFQQNLSDVKVLLGFTFSFPVNQTAVASGTLIHWTKGFTTSGVVGQDVVQLLTDAFVRNNVNAQVVALANDTVGTMMARSYTDTSCEMGVILGTGTNACYIEKTRNIKKLRDGSYTNENMIINMEWGGFGDHSNYLPLTKEDKLLDEASVNPTKQIFEKMISGMYLGEIVRYIIKDSMDAGLLGQGFSSLEWGKSQYHFETAFVSQILLDNTFELENTKKLLEEKLASISTYEERILIKDICKSVTTRAARLSATAIVAVLSKIDRLKGTIVAVDGSVFEKVPNFKEEMDRTIKLLYPQSSVKLVLTQDGSGNGAAIIASTLL